jgi:hypothetical protein
MIAATFQERGNLILPKALGMAHDELRARLVIMMIGGGPIMVAAKRLAELCLPHFVWEERTIFPVLNLLPDLALGNRHPQIIRMLPLINEFNRRQAELASNHMLIMSAIELLRKVAERTKNGDCENFVLALKIHEELEDAIVYPLVRLIGQHLHQHMRVTDDCQLASSDSAEALI